MRKAGRRSCDSIPTSLACGATPIPRTGRRGGWLVLMIEDVTLIRGDEITVIPFSLSPGQNHDAPEGRRLLSTLDPPESWIFMVMDRAYEGDDTRQLVLALGFTPVVPPPRDSSQALGI